jgi:5-hydroxyisourate hydrolase
VSSITTHVLDTSRGRPARGVPVRLEHDGERGWAPAGAGETDADGRCAALLDGPLRAGRYRLVFDTGAYFRAAGVRGFYPDVTVHFEVEAPEQHHHVPLLLNPFGYSTYRGS